MAGVKVLLYPNSEMVASGHICAACRSVLTQNSKGGDKLVLLEVAVYSVRKLKFVTVIVPHHVVNYRSATSSSVLHTNSRHGGKPPSRR